MAISPAIQAHFDKTKAHIDAIDKGIDGVSGDITELKRIIVQLQSTQGVLSAEDQDLLDQAEVLVNTASAKVTALDELTPPPPPPTA